jgi:PAS domain S-box-containing protein
MPRILSTILSLSILLCVGIATGFAQSRNFTVGLEQNPPICSIDSKGKPVGISVDILQEIARREGWHLNWQPCLWEQCLEKLANGQLDLLSGIGRTTKREDLYNFNAEPVVINWGQLYSSNKSKINTMLDLTGKRIALVPTDLHGAHFQDSLTRFGIKTTLVAVNSYGEGVQAVLEQRADACVVSRIFPLAAKQLDHITKTPIIFNPSQNMYATAKGHHTPVLAAIDRHLTQMKAEENSFYHQSLERHLGMPESRKLPAWLGWTLSITMLLTALIAGNNIICRRKIKAKTAELQKTVQQVRTLSLAVEQSPESVVITDLDGVIEYVNPAYCTTSGYDMHEVIGQHSRHLKSDQQPPELYKELWETITNGKIWKGELHNKKKDGTLFLEALTISPICEDTGTIIRYMAIKVDITKQRRLEQQQKQTKRLELIGHLAGGVAHEVRNPLNAILSMTEALFREKEFQGNDNLAPYQHHIRSQVTRLSRLMNDLLDLGRTIPETSLTPSPPRELCREVVALAHMSETCSSCTILFDMNPFAAEAVVMADRIRLQQILINLLENACQHSPPEAEVTLRLFLSDPQTLCFQIKDSGTGIPPDNLDRIFEPFFTNRRGGTRLGLAIAKHFSEAMGGTITIYNNDPSPGCTAKLTLPII